MGEVVEELCKEAMEVWAEACRSLLAECSEWIIELGGSFELIGIGTRKTQKDTKDKTLRNIQHSIQHSADLYKKHKTTTLWVCAILGHFITDGLNHEAAERSDVHRTPCSTMTWTETRE